MKKLLIVGSLLDYGIDYYYYQYLKAFFDEVEIFCAPDLFNDFYFKHIGNKFLFKSGYRGIYKIINSLFCKTIERYKPDVILIFKGMELYPESLGLAKKRGIRLTNYNADHPFYFHGNGSGNKNIVDSFPLYNMHISYSTAIIEEIKQRGNFSTGCIPFGYEIDDKLYASVKHLPEINACCFIGNPDQIRKEMITHLLKNDIPVAVYGYRWNRFLSEKKFPNFSIYQPVYHKELWVTILKYRVQLNIFRPHNAGSHNMRSFEIPAAGGIQIAPYSDEHLFYFNENKEIFLYKNLDDLTEKVKSLLQLDAIAANQYRHYARQRSINSGYSYKERARLMADCLYKLGD